ncbi:MAG: hypothetical protein ABJO30_14560 [Hyphomicrobiales bacterium]
MFNFELFWQEFDYIIDEISNHGMCFFVGYLPSISNDNMDAGLRALTDAPLKADLRNSVWSDSSVEQERRRSYSAEEYLELFKSGKITMLNAEYRPTQCGLQLHLKLMIDKRDDKLDLENISYREPILSCDEPKRGVKTAATEFVRLKKLFDGEVLFVGPDTLNYPDDTGTHPKEWIKIVTN